MSASGHGRIAVQRCNCRGSSHWTGKCALKSREGNKETGKKSCGLHIDPDDIRCSNCQIAVDIGKEASC